MHSTSRARSTFKQLLLMRTDVAVCPFPVIDRALEWYNAFAHDHDAEFLLRGITNGFSYQLEDPDPGGEYYMCLFVLGVVDKDHSDMMKVRAVHNLSRPEGASTNDGIDIPHSSLPTVGDAFVLLQQPGWYQAKVRQWSTEGNRSDKRSSILVQETNMIQEERKKEIVLIIDSSIVVQGTHETHLDNKS
jgi:hypothetical protein